MRTNYVVLQAWCLALMAFRYILHFVPFLGYSDLYVRFSQAVAVTSIFLLLISIRNVRVNKQEIILSILSVFIVYIFLLKLDWLSLITSITYIWPIVLMAISGISVLNQAFKNFVFLYAISLVPSIILYPFIALGAISPVDIIQPSLEIKNTIGMYYENYLLTFRLVEMGGLMVNDGGFFRISGFFDEPGVVGTFSAFILITLGYRLKEWKNYVILAAGILSFSLAFYIISVLYFILKGGSAEKSKILIALLIFYVIGSNIPFVQERIFDRVLISDGKIAGDNRLTEDVAITMERFLVSDDKWLGYSKRLDETDNVGGASWQALVWDYGIVGVFFISVFFFLLARSKPIIFSRESVVFIILFVFSIYQRPHVFEPSYILLFIGGLVYISNSLRCELKSNVPIIS